jgi:aspartokinase-like uncharacterized kinase
MEAVIKIGGSLSQTPDILRTLGVELGNIARKHQVVMVPGGGKFADVVRELDAKFKLPAIFSHRMAILAMDQNGLFLSQIIPEACICDSLEDAERLSKQCKVALFLPSRLLFENDPFPPSWDVTSDSIAAHIAIELKAAKAVFLTDVDGIFTQDPKQHPEAKLLSGVSADELLRRVGRTSVDRFLPELLMENKLDTYVVNGAFPQRINDILSGQSTICSHINPV